MVIHLGAMTGVDLCEKEESMAFDVNAKSTQIIAQAMFKTEHVFGLRFN